MSIENLKYYLVKVKVEITYEDTDKTKWISESYIFKAVSPTDVDVKVSEYFGKNSLNYRITNIALSNIIAIIE